MRCIYFTHSNNCVVKSLRELRTHVEFFGRIRERNEYDGDYVQRLVYQAGRWVLDEDYLLRIDVVKSKVIFRREKYPRYASTVQYTPSAARSK